MPKEFEFDVTPEVYPADFLALMENLEVPEPPYRNQFVEGEIVGVHSGGLYVTFGQKADSEAPAKEIDGDFAVGEKHTFLVISEPDDEGAVTLSQIKAKAWKELIDLVESQTVSSATVGAVATSRAGRVSGVKARISGISAFIPRSEINHHGKLDRLVGQEIDVKVLEANPAAGRIGKVILSQAKAAEELQDAVLETIEAGQNATGVVSKILDIGALVDLGDGLTGLIYRTELAGERNVIPSEVLSEGETVEVKILKVDRQRRRISLSRRAAMQESFLAGLQEGTRRKGVVARFQTYGAFVRMGDCIDGLLHKVDLLSEGNRTETFEIGEEIEVIIKQVDRDNNRISLTRQGIPSSEDEGDVEA